METVLAGRLRFNVHDDRSVSIPLNHSINNA